LPTDLAVSTTPLVNRLARLATKMMPSVPAAQLPRELGRVQDLDCIKIIVIINLYQRLFWELNIFCNNYVQILFS
jgi:hypothetical protein